MSDYGPLQPIIELLKIIVPVLATISLFVAAALLRRFNSLQQEIDEFNDKITSKFDDILTKNGEKFDKVHCIFRELEGRLSRIEGRYDGYNHRKEQP